ncbi:phage portal protein [Hymenobacter sp. NBH84]|uniref:phage portal protein n=1 Tax=Hymenobacter sp. NBH84 TaxID=2596915 RepID=UPI001627E4ED|nr:phage portal protein [Hymenobacter sp. NBH84]QNE38984.1 phage portal protein [Hymenobacter sp. NBH84]
MNLNLNEVVAKYNAAIKSYDQKLVDYSEKKSFGVDSLGRPNPISLSVIGGAEIDWSNKKDFANIYETNGTPNIIIRYILRFASQIPWKVWELDAKGKPAKLLENHEVTNRLWNPNDKESTGELIYKLGLSLLTEGNAYLWANRVSGNRIGALWSLPPSKVEIIGGGWREYVTGYRYYKSDGTYENLKAEDVMHLKYISATDSKYGSSPMAAAIKLIVAAESGTDLRAKHNQNGGPQGILFHDDPNSEPLDAAAANSIKAKIKSFFSPRRALYDIPYSDAKLGYLKVGSSSADLNLIEAARFDKNAICDIYSFPTQLLSAAEGTTYSNVGEASKGLYTKCIIPLLRQIQEKLNRFLTDKFIKAGENIYVDFDTSLIPELQEDKKDLSVWIDKAWYLTANEKRELMGYQKINEELMDTVLIPKNLGPVDSTDALQPQTPEKGETDAEKE